jgi:hypothetical protein
MLMFDSSFSLFLKKYETKLFFFVCVCVCVFKHGKNASSGEESSDSESESESSNVSSGSGSLSTQPKKAGNVDSGSSKQESTSQQPRYLSSVDFNRIVEKCFQMVMLGDIGQIPDVLEMENLSPQQKVMIYDELQKKLDQLEKEET